MAEGDGRETKMYNYWSFRVISSKIVREGEIKCIFTHSGLSSERHSLDFEA